MDRVPRQSRPKPDLLHAILKTHRSDVRKLSLQGLLPFHGSPSKSSGFRHGCGTCLLYRAAPGRGPGCFDRFLIREAPDAFMLSCLVDYLRLVVRVRPQVSVSVSGDRHSVSYSPRGSARSGPDPNLLIRRFLSGCPAGFRAVRDLGLVSVGCPRGFGASQGCPSVWLQRGSQRSP